MASLRSVYELLLYKKLYFVIFDFAKSLRAEGLCATDSFEMNILSEPSTTLLFLCLQYVMIVLKGSVPIAFGGTEEPAAYGELVSIGGLTPDVNKKLSAAISAILETKLSVPKSRFFLKFYDTKASYIIDLLTYT